jgi:hypothetical protein
VKLPGPTRQRPRASIKGGELVTLEKYTFDDLKLVLDILIGRKYTQLLVALYDVPEVKDAVGVIETQLLPILRLLGIDPTVVIEGVEAALIALLGVGVKSLTAAAVSLFLTIVVLITYHQAVIVAQIWFWENCGRLANGACLKHPLLVLAGAMALTGPTVFLPIVIAQVGLHFPVAVTPRLA